MDLILASSIRSGSSPPANWRSRWAAGEKQICSRWRHLTSEDRTAKDIGTASRGACIRPISIEEEHLWPYKP